MPPTLKRILWAGVPTAVLLAGLGFALAEMADLFLATNRPARELEVVDGAAPADAPPADPVPDALRRTLPLTMAAWGFALVAGYEGVRRLVKGPAKRPGAMPKPPTGGDVDKMLADLMRKAEADRSGLADITPPPGGPARVSTAKSGPP